MNLLKYFIASLVLLYTCMSCKKNALPENNNIQPVNYRLKLSGSIQTCNGNNLTNGYVIILSDNGYYSININNGMYDTTLESSVHSFDSLFVWAIDLDSLKTSDTLSIALHGDSIHLPQLNACSADADEYINCRIDNEKYIYIPAYTDSIRAGGWDTLQAPTTYIYRTDFRFIHNAFNRMQFAGESTGIFYFNWNSTFHIGSYYEFNMPVTDYVNYTRYENVGGYIEGSIYAPFIDNNDGSSHIMTGTFKVRRDY